MARKNIKAEIPIKSPDGMIKLAEDLKAKHDTFGGTTDSSLHHYDMGAFGTKTTNAKNKLTDARTNDNQAQGLTQNSYTLMGFAEGQTIETEGTLYFTLDAIRLTLIAHHDGEEEKLQQYGFNIVIGETRGRRTVRASIPTKKPDDFLTLCKEITKKHEALAAASPLHHMDMASFKTKTTDAFNFLAQARSKHGTAEGETQTAYRIIGMGKGQNLRSEGTLYNLIARMKNNLLASYKGNEELLEEWGFNVVITETTASRSSKRITIIIPKLGFITRTDIINHSTGKNIGVTDLEWCASPTLCTPENANVLNPDEEAEINTLDGPVTIKNRSNKFSGRIRMSVTP